MMGGVFLRFYARPCRRRRDCARATWPRTPRRVEEPRGLGHDARPVGADEAHRAGLDRLRALGGLAHHEHGLAERGRLLLDAAGIGEHQVRAAHEVDEGDVVQRRQQVHVRGTAQDAAHRLLHVGVEVYRVHDLDVASRSELRQRPADVLEPLAEALAAVPGDEHEALARVQEGELRVERSAQGRVRVEAGDHREERVDDGVARDQDGRVVHTLAQQVLARLLGGGEMVPGDAGGEAAVHLLRPRGVDVARPQSRFHVPDGNAAVVGREARAQRGRRVAVHEHQVRLLGVEHGLEAPQDAGEDVG